MGLLILARLRMAWNVARRMGLRDALKALGFAALGGLFLVLLYAGFVRLLSEVKSVQLIGGLLALKLIAMAFLTTFLMIAFSSTLASFSTLFFARDLHVLMHSPLSFRTVFLFKALETAVFSSWMVVLAMLPFLAAYGHVYGLGPGFYSMLAVLSVPFVLTACAIGIGLSLTLMCLFPSKRVREVMLILGVVAGCSLYVLIRWLGPEQLVRADSFEVVLQYVALLEAPTAPYLPSWWMASAVAAYVSSRAMGLLGPAALLFGTALAAWAALAAFAERAYYGGWTSAQEASRRRTVSPPGSEWRWFPRALGPRFRAMLGKDAIIFVRDPNQWSQLLMLFSLAAVYLISVRRLPLDTPYLKSLVSFLNIGLAGFVLASVALRFVFPAVSLEGKSWWALRSAPMGLWTVLWGKFLSGFIPLSVLGVALVWASNRFLGVDPFVVWLSNGTILLMAFTLSGMGVGFGALFPRFQVENVAQIETSPGGLLYMVAAMFYVALTLALESVVMRRHYMLWMRPGPAGTAEAWIVVVLVLAVSAAAFAAPFAAGKRHLETADL